MNKAAYLEKLKACLRWRIPKTELEDIIRDYAEYFEEGRRQSKADSEISARLGDPKIVAEQIIVESRQQEEERPDYLEAVKQEVLETKKEILERNEDKRGATAPKLRKNGKNVRKQESLEGEAGEERGEQTAFARKFWESCKKGCKNFFHMTGTGTHILLRLLGKGVLLFLWAMREALVLCAAMALLLFQCLLVVLGGTLTILGVILLVLSGVVMVLLSLWTGIVVLGLALAGIGIGITLLVWMLGKIRRFFRAVLQRLQKDFASCPSFRSAARAENPPSRDPHKKLLEAPEPEQSEEPARFPEEPAENVATEPESIPTPFQAELVPGEEAEPRRGEEENA